MLYRRKNPTQQKQKPTVENNNQLLRLTHENHYLNSRILALQKQLKQTTMTKDKYKTKYKELKSLYTQYSPRQKMPSHTNSQFITKTFEDNPYHLTIPQNQKTKKIQLTKSIEKVKQNLSQFMNILEQVNQKIVLISQNFHIHGKLDFISKKISQLLEVFRESQIKRGRSGSSSSILSKKKQESSRERSTSKIQNKSNPPQRRNRALTQSDSRWKIVRDIGQELQEIKLQSGYFQDSEEYQNN